MHVSLLAEYRVVPRGAVFVLLVLFAISPLRAHDTTTLPALVAKVSGAVVNISVVSNRPAKGAGKGFDLEKLDPETRDFFKKFFDGQKRTAKVVKSAGSGFVIDPSGVIVTASFVVDGEGEIVVTLASGEKLQASLVGRDKKSTVAVLRVSPVRPLTAVRFGNSDTIKIGEPVFAIGTQFGLAGSVTSGIISAVNRDINQGPYDRYIQTDAATNKGSAGGPLFNMNGDVIGINTAILSPSGHSVGLSFAVPANFAVPIIEQLRTHGEVRRGYLGVQIQSVTAEVAEALGLDKPAGALVAGVTKDSPAQTAGITAGEVVLEIEGRPVADQKHLAELIAQYPPGKTISILLLRQGERKTVQTTLAQLKKPTKTSAGSKPAAPKVELIHVAGLTLKTLTPALRKTHAIKDDIEGVLIDEIDPNSEAAGKGLARGHVILEVSQKKVSAPSQVGAAVAAARKEGRKSVLLLYSRGDRELRFIALPL